ncbi:hypothetical protein [Solirubrum puertoriconensis]|uniref:Antitoxin VbhA domain-containing protein n=1 Tax=Solirubrum puertoriconensis TaxID=1751427 RepID=A0A9X0HN19_SOLP1|nr:hypothetical protein [Solirubrum puertoriconensis]KUG09056.1 hypothetical protein ASU33_19740 [Solirubrum puertoriconensis]
MSAPTYQAFDPGIQHPFSLPPSTLPADEQQRWLARLQQAESWVGFQPGGVPTGTADTLLLLERYVRGELTAQQVAAVQQHRRPRA